jgi:hypothetical protein
MTARARDMVLAALAAVVVGVAALGVAMGLPGLQPPPSPPPSGEGGAALRYVCSEDHASFTIAELARAPEAGARDDPAHAALLALIDEQARLEEGEIGAEGWHRVVDSPEEVVFLAETPESEAPFAVVHVVPGDAGMIVVDGWAVDSYGACTPRPVVPDELSVADWWVDPDVEPIGPDSVSIPALVRERACASEQSAEGRIQPPSIFYGPTEVTITIVVERRTGVQACPGNPLTPFIIELAEPLGDRTLVDGGQFPPGDPLEPPDS